MAARDNGDRLPLPAPRGDGARVRRVPKLCGTDVEFGNFYVGRRGDGERTVGDAARALLAEIDGVPQRRASGSYTSEGTAPVLWTYTAGTGAYGYSRHAQSPSLRTDDVLYESQDWGRKFLSNGQCWYIDLSHLEGCIPEVRSARDWVAAWHALLRVARRAQERASVDLRHGQRIEVLANNSDGLSNSYGSHVSFLVSRDAFENIFTRKAHHLAYLAAYQVSSIVFTGQGKVGAENDTPPVPYQLFQRADFFESLVGPQTTHCRPIVNSRDEPLCGGHDASDLARLHCIFYDSTLCHVSSYLKIGAMQLVLAMLEAGRINPDLLLDDPLAAVQAWSRDPTLQARAETVAGRAFTAVELQLSFCEEARRFVAAGECEGIVPDAEDIVRLWEETLVQLDSGDLAALTGRLDWVLKLHTLERAFRRRPDLTWTSPEIKALDHLYSSVAPNGLYWPYENGNVVERIVSDEQIAHFVDHPPSDTRAWTRGMLLRSVDREDIETVDWDHIVFRWRPHPYLRLCRRLELPNPLAFTRGHTEHLFREAEDLDALLDALGAAAPVRGDAATRAVSSAVH